MSEHDAKSIFLAAADKSTPAERDSYLNEACGDDDRLRQRVQALLKAHDEPGSFMESPAAEFVNSPTVVQAPIAEKPGMTIGRYKLLEQIGEGGFGVVFMAEQTEPIRRKVALKVIKPGMDTKDVIARFEAERQALALMDHANIAKVLDAGATESGRPYFVMELVRGVPITEYCDHNHLSARQRLELFDSVCRAVQHAHQKGIIHRDVKPSNVLVTMRDDTAVPKVIDFGVAKATNQRLTERTLFTGYAQMLGTPLYMSPEQAQMNELDVDTRSDIYSLGVLLYELLTGITPFDRKRLREAAYDELLRIIREEEPPKPSTRISTLGESAVEVSAHRQTDPKNLSRLLHGELDWIVMKAMEKDRTRRYESANGLAADVRRYLADETVTACPPTAAYRFKKFARRNKRVLGTVAVVGIVLVSASVFSAWQAIRATNAEQIAQANLIDANVAREEAESNFRKAREAVDKYFTLVSENTLLDRPDLEDLRSELLDSALTYYKDFAEQRADDPEMPAELVAAHFRIAQLGNAMHRADWLASFDRGVKIAEQLASENVDVSQNSTWRAGIITLRQNETLLDENAKVLPVFQKASKIWEMFVQRYPDVPGLQNDLATMYLVVGTAQDNPLAAYEAYKLAREVLEGLVRNHPAKVGYRLRLAVLLHELAYNHKSNGRFAESEREWRQAIDLFEDLVSELPGVPVYRNRLAESQHTLAGILAKTGHPREAEELWKSSIAIRRQLLAEFPRVPRYRSRLAASYFFLRKFLKDTGRYEEAADAVRGINGPTAYGIAQSKSSWTTNITDPNRTLGIDAASVSFVTLQAGPPEGVPFVVWSDLPNGNSGSGVGRIGGASYEGQHRATDGRGVQFHGETTDGKTGTVTIADVPYDLANGSLFLASTQHDPPTVAQIAYDTSKFPKGKDQLIRLAKSIPDIRAFWEKHKKTNEGGQNE